MATTLGAHSPKLEALRALRTKAGRREQLRYAIEGPTLLGEALAAGRTPDAVYATEDALLTHRELLGPLDERTFVVPERALARASELETPPGTIAVLPLALEPLEALLASGQPAIVLAGISDPGNAGTLLRSAEIFGIGQAVFARSGVEPHNPKVVRATMGALFRMRLAVGGPDELVEQARAHSYEIVAAARNGVPLPEFRFPPRALIAIGNERHGVASWLPRWDTGVAIPQPGGGESLNASVAGGIIFYAFSQQFSSQSF
jgi:TrmH family RNA methyltransferase